MRRLLWAFPLLVCAALVGCGEGSSAGRARPGVKRPPKAAKPYEYVPATVSELDAAIAEESGKVVLVDFWATWCPPCVASFPNLVHHHEKYAQQGLVVFAVSMDYPETVKEVQPFLKQQNAQFECFYLKDGDREDENILEKRFRHRGSIPHAVLFNKQGERVWAGHPNSGNLDKRIQDELAK